MTPSSLSTQSTQLEFTCKVEKKETKGGITVINHTRGARFINQAGSLEDGLYLLLKLFWVFGKQPSIFWLSLKARQSRSISFNHPRDSPAREAASLLDRKSVV